MTKPLDLFKDFTSEEIRILTKMWARSGKGRGKWTRTTEDNRRNSQLRKEYWASLTMEKKEEILAKRSKSMTNYWKSLSQEELNRRSNWLEGIWTSYTPKEKQERLGKTLHSLEAKEKAAKGRRRYLSKLSSEEKKEWVNRSFLNEKAKEKKPEATRRVWAGYTEEEKKARLEASFNSEEAFLRSAQNRKIPPSEPEKWLGWILDETFSGKFGYNGDGRLDIRVGRRIPDFVSLDGQKKAISVMGGLGYLHYYEDDVEEEKYYKERGWSILVIWDYEIYPVEDTVKRIESFLED